jgi:quinol monooxygenase YgiN
MLFAYQEEYPDGLMLEGSEGSELMIHASIRMKMPGQKVREAVETLHSVAELTRLHPGCISCWIYHDAQEEQVIMIEEVWRSQEELESHLRSPDYRNVLLVVEMAREKPEIKFKEFSDSTGIETIEKAISGGRRGERT